MKKLLTIMFISVLPALGFSASNIDQQSQASSNNIQRQLQQRGNLIPPPNRGNSQVQNFGRFNSNQNQRDTAPAANRENSQTQNSQRNDSRMQRQQMRNPGMRQGFNPNASVVTPEERLNRRTETTEQGSRASMSRPQPQVHQDVPMNSEAQSRDSVRKIQSRNQAMTTNDKTSSDNNIQSRR
ncbi:hypothetical protein [Francisella frigiditurris]|uniref:Uncharacterized protein n=1 Tax=Francisella frigiditurris TaxID=1542390 RepID=A0A1J0KTJ3_9GAMM|nr:hypothetical protein [Francisella frigiditurris]APC97073.1 hypothetical protein KX01_1400 [Francisella frigiditurris]